MQINNSTAAKSKKTIPHEALQRLQKIWTITRHSAVLIVEYLRIVPALMLIHNRNSKIGALLLDSLFKTMMDEDDYEDDVRRVVFQSMYF